MRLVGDDGKELVATDEQLASATQLGNLIHRDVQHANLSFNALTSLAGLQVATQLRNLNVSHNALTSLRGVEAFQQLRRLRCTSNSISDLSCLTSLPSLEELWINDNEVEAPQIAHLAAIRTLRVLVIHPNPCTNAPHYVNVVVKSIPWLSCLDMIVVDETLRQQSQHADDRAFLSSAATDVSEISLMTSRSDGTQPEVELQQQASEQEVATKLAPSVQLSSSQQKVVVKPKKAKMTAEDFLRAFPIQDFIPSGNETDKVDHIQPHEETPDLAKDVDADGYISPATTQGQQTTALELNHSSNNLAERGNESVMNTKEQLQNEEYLSTETPTLSAIASAVLTLPLFGDDSILSKAKPKSLPMSNAAKAAKKASTTKHPVAVSNDPTLASFQQPEWTQPYPNSTVSAIQIRPDGSALAKWSNGNVAVSIDRERDGFRCYAAHKDGAIALSFDASGVGFINYHPSGRMMISTSSSGDGLYFSPDGSIARQWNAQLNMKNEKWEATSSLSDSEPDGSLLSRLSDGLGIRFQLRPTDASQRPSPVHLIIYFNSGSGIRHAFCNWINKSETTANECDVVFGKEQPKLKKKASDSSQSHSHLDMLSDIRAAVAKLG